MTNDEAKKLFELSENGFHVMYTDSPYVSGITSSRIDEKDGKYLYSDDVFSDIDILDESRENFEVYQKHDYWYHIENWDGGLSFPTT